MSKWSAWPFTPIKDLSEIRQRHARHEAMSSLWDLNPYDMHRDREWLLAEVERLRAALREAALMSDCCAWCRAEVADFCRKALKAKP